MLNTLTHTAHRFSLLMSIGTDTEEEKKNMYGK